MESITEDNINTLHIFYKNLANKISIEELYLAIPISKSILINFINNKRLYNNTYNKLLAYKEWYNDRQSFATYITRFIGLETYKLTYYICTNSNTTISCIVQLRHNWNSRHCWVLLYPSLFKAPTDEYSTLNYLEAEKNNNIVKLAYSDNNYILVLNPLIFTSFHEVSEFIFGKCNKESDDLTYTVDTSRNIVKWCEMKIKDSTSIKLDLVYVESYLIQGLRNWNETANILEFITDSDKFKIKRDTQHIGRVDNLRFLTNNVITTRDADCCIFDPNI